MRCQILGIAEANHTDASGERCDGERAQSAGLLMIVPDEG